MTLLRDLYGQDVSVDVDVSDADVCLTVGPMPDEKLGAGAKIAALSPRDACVLAAQLRKAAEEAERYAG